MMSYSMFQEDWWLDATAPGAWDAVEIESEGTVNARWPFTIRKKFGRVILGQPQLTQTLGPWIAPTTGKPSRRLSRELDLYDRLLDLLPKHDYLSQRFSPEITNWLPFYWNGFDQTTRYTYTIDLDEPLDQIMSSMEKNARSRIRKSSSSLHVDLENDLSVLIEANDKTFKRQGLQAPYPPELLERIDEAVLKNAHRWLSVVRDDDGAVHSAAYLVGDKRRVYMLVSGGDPALRNSGAGYLSKWFALKCAHGTSKVFDFEGSMMKSVERFNRSFGAVQTPYFEISRIEGRILRSALSLRDSFTK